jgi:PAS domain S-box-containing protein
MRDKDMTREQLLAELAGMRQLVKEMSALQVTHRQVEEALRESEEKYRNLVERANDGIAILQDTLYRYVNPRLGMILGYSVDELVGTSFTGYVAPEELPRLVDRYQRRMAGRDVEQIYESAVKRRDGRIVPVEINAGLISYGGRPADLVIIRDITERKQTEEALRRSEERYALAQRAAGIGSWDWDITTGALHWSAEVEPVFGFEAGGFDGTYEAFLQCIHPEDRQRVEDSVRACVERGEEYAIEHRIVWPDGTVRCVAETGDVVRDERGRAVRMVGVVQAITDRKQAERALRESLESREELERIINWSPAVVFLWRAAEGWPVEFVSENVRQFGYSPDDFTSGSSPYASIVHPDDLDRVAAEVTQYCNEGHERFEQEYRVLTAAGEVRWLDDRTWVRRDKEGSVTHFQGIVLDITKRKQAQQDLRQYAAELEARNEELDAFSHTVAHDLQNPLGIIVGYAEMMEEDCEAVPVEDQRRFLGMIARAGRKASSIIDELLLLASVRKVEQVMVEPLDMGRIVDEAQERLADLVDGTGAEIRRPDVWPTALGYGPWVEEVWVNYLSNAIKYGGRPPRIELGAAEQPDGSVRFWVRDNGPGIPSRERNVLFTPFGRLSEMQISGHGLGLSIVRRIVNKLGGDVAVDSEPGKGSVFSFSLPRHGQARTGVG